jgi:hypothetical protein
MDRVLNREHVLRQRLNELGAEAPHLGFLARHK